MAADEPSGARPPVVLRIKLRYDDLETMVARFAPNVGKSGLFLPTKSIQPVGTEVKFELRLADDKPVLVGLGRVRASRAQDPANPKAAFGMAVELLRVNREGRDLILKMLERRRSVGLAEVTLPLPDDVDAARAETTGVRDTAVAPQPLANLETPAESLMTAPRRQSGPIGVAKDLSVKALAPEPARRKRPAVAEVIANAQSGPVAVAAMPELDADVDVGAAMVRARALAAGADLDAELEALRDAGAAPIEISIEAASAELARQLGGVAVDRRDRSARWAPPPPIAVPEVAPVAVSVPEPAVVAPVAVSAPEAAAVIASEAAAEPVPVNTREVERIAVVVEAVEPAFVPQITEVEHEFALPDAEADEPVAVSDAEIVEENAASQVTEAPHEPALVEVGDDHEELFAARVIARPATRPPAMIDDDVDPGEFERSDVTVGPSPTDRAQSQRLLAERLADQRNEQLEEEIEDEIEQLSEMDLEDASEHTFAGALPVDPHAEDSAGPDFGSFAEPYPEAAVHELADRLDAQLADAEAEAEAELGFDRALAAELPEEIPEEQIEEVDDFEILAEADADDADLLLADGERDISRSHPVVDPEPTPLPAPLAAHVYDPDPEPPPLPPPVADEPAMRPSYLDFAARLELSDEHAPAPDEPDPLAGFDDPDPMEFDAPHSDFSAAPSTAFEAPAYAPEPTPLPRELRPVRGFDESDLEAHAAPRFLRAPAPARTPVKRAPTPAPVRTPTPSHARSRAASPAAPGDQLDLESALEALDVDLDDLSIPGTAITPSAPERPRQPTPARPLQTRPAPSPAPLRAPRPAPSPAPLAGRAPSASPAPAGKRPPRATSDDGILIDFDDDD